MNSNVEETVKLHVKWIKQNHVERMETTPCMLWLTRKGEGGNTGENISNHEEWYYLNKLT